MGSFALDPSAPKPVASSLTRHGRRDRHGRGFRRVLIGPHLPGYRTRREIFDDVVAEHAGALFERFPRQLEHVQVLVEDVPPSDPAAWEHSAASLGRTFPGTHQQPPRVVVYRLPIHTRAQEPALLETMVRQVLAEQVGALLGRAGHDIDPDAFAD